MSAVSPGSRDRRTCPPVARLRITSRPVRSNTLLVSVLGEADPGTAPRLQDHPPAGLRAAGLRALICARDAAAEAGVGFRVLADARVVLVPLTVPGPVAAFDVHARLDHVPARDRGRPHPRIVVGGGLTPRSSRR